jgi:hypothetical protein
MVGENGVNHEVYAKGLQMGSYIYSSAGGGELCIVLSKGSPGDSLQALKRRYEHPRFP